MPKAVSQKQAALFGALIAGKPTKASGMTPEQARKHLQGVKVNELPVKKKKKRRA